MGWPKLFPIMASAYDPALPKLGCHAISAMIGLIWLIAFGVSTRLGDDVLYHNTSSPRAGSAAWLQPGSQVWQLKLGPRLAAKVAAKVDSQARILAARLESLAAKFGSWNLGPSLAAKVGPSQAAKVGPSLAAKLVSYNNNDNNNEL